MNGTRIGSIGLTLLAVLTSAPAARADDLSGRPRMTRPQAFAYLQANGIEASPDSLSQQIITGGVEAVDALVAAGVDVRARTSLPQSSLTLAAMTCAGGRLPTSATLHMMDTLVEAGADANAPGMSGLGPLMVASQQCKAPVVKRLLAAGARLDSRTPQGFTPLSMALTVGNYDAAEALIDGGARLSAESGRKLQTPGNRRLNELVARATRGS